MSVTTIEGVVKDGKIVLPKDLKLPESARVYVVVPEIETRTARIMSPRLADPSRIKDFEREVTDIGDDEI
jgi:hypothetical protein